MLNEQLQKQIEQEAVHEASLHFHPQYSPDQNTACRINYKNGASRYAALWQAAEEKAEKYEKALREIANPMAYLQRKAEEEGSVLNGMAFQATDALTPKTGEDEKA